MAQKRSGVVTWEGLKKATLETISSLPPIPIVADPIVTNFDRRAFNLPADNIDGVRITGTQDIQNKSQCPSFGREFTSDS